MPYSLPILTLQPAQDEILAERWLREALPDAIPEERTATCTQCAMIDSPAASDGQPRGFLPDVKCCSYFPRLTNFQIGGILNRSDDASAPARDFLRRQIPDSAVLTMFGLVAPQSYQLKYEGSGGRAFGKSRTLLCPFFVNATDGRSCTIWEHRNAVCRTWYCKHDRGAVGKAFWQCVHSFLEEIETSLSEWCAAMLGFKDRIRSERHNALDKTAKLAAELCGNGEPVGRQAYWNKWYEREESYFIECDKLVSPLSLTTILGIAGARGQQKREDLLAAYSQLVNRTDHERLLAGQLSATPETRTAWRVSSYSKLDPLIIPSDLLLAMPYFDGRALPVILEEVQRETGIVIERSLIERLIDFEILLPLKDMFKTPMSPEPNGDV
jgi:hypothetical protein